MITRRGLYLSSLFAITQHHLTKALDCRAENKPTCTTTDDCAIAFGDEVPDTKCGNLFCMDNGNCHFNPYNGDCQQFFQLCNGDDAKCTKGPGLGRCNGWQNEQCTYEWCVQYTEKEEDDKAGGDGMGEVIGYERNEPYAFQTWAKTARIGGARMHINMKIGEVNHILDKLVSEGVSVVEGESGLANYLKKVELDEELAFIRMVCDAAHKRGLRVVWYYPALKVLTPNGKNATKTMFKDHPEWVQMGLDRKTPSVFYDDGVECAWMSPSSGYRSYFIDRVRRIASSSGVDGLWLGVPHYAHSEKTPWADASALAVDSFQKKTEEYFSGKIAWDKFAWRRWISWRHAEIASFVKEVTAAALEVNPEFTIYVETESTDDTGRTLCGLDGGHLKYTRGVTHVWKVESISHKSGMRKAKEDDWISYISSVKYARAASGNSPSWVFSYGMQKNDAEQVMTQSMAVGHNPYEVKVPDMATSVGGDFRKRMFKWVKSNSQYLHQSKSKATVGVLYSSPSNDYIDKGSGLGKFVSWDGQDDKQWWTSTSADSAYDLPHLAEFRGIIKMLVHEHIPFNILVYPDARELRDYKTLILPNVQAMSDDEGDMIRDFVTNGGHLFVTGPNPGGLDEFGTKRTELLLSDVMGFKKKKIPMKKQTFVGKGSVAYYKKKLGKKYFNNDDSDMKVKLANPIREVSNIEVVINAPPQVFMEVSELNNDLILQFTNFIGVSGNFSVVPEEVKVEVTLPPSRSASKVAMSSPNLQQNVKVPFTNSADTKIMFTLTVKQYALVVVSLKTDEQETMIENDDPVAGDDFFKTAPNTPLTFNQSSLLTNDGDLDGDTIQVTNVRPSKSTVGSVVDVGDGSYKFTPETAFVGTEVLIYEVSDGRGGMGVGRIVIDVAILPYYPQLIDVEKGQASDGDLMSLTKADEDTLKIKSKHRFSSGQIVDWSVRAVIKEDPSRIKSMVVTYISKYSLKNITQTMYLYNFPDGWEEVDESTVGKDSYLVWVPFDENSVGKYISPEKEVRARIKAVHDGKEVFVSKADFFSWKVTGSSSDENDSLSDLL